MVICCEKYFLSWKHLNEIISLILVMSILDFYTSSLKIGYFIDQYRFANFLKTQQSRNPEAIHLKKRIEYFINKKFFP